MNENKPELMTIGVLAKEAGVGVETVRFYQRQGLLKTPDKTSGFRKYSQAELQQIKFIKRIQELGFSLKDAQKLLEISFCSEETRPQLQQACNEKIEQIEKKIADLNGMLDELRLFRRSCASDASGDCQCKLLDCFENDWECCGNTERKKK